jgi:predicted nucleotide-binding protein
MTPAEELFLIAERMDEIWASAELKDAEGDLSSLEQAAIEVGRSASGSWLGYHAHVYYRDFAPPPSGARFSQEWGLEDMSFTSMGSRGDWCEVDPKEVLSHIGSEAGNPDLSNVRRVASEAESAFKIAKADVSSILITENANAADPFLTKLTSDLEKIEPLTAGEIIEIWSPKGQVMTRDMVAVGQRSKIPPHMIIKGEVASLRQAFNICHEAGQISRKAASHIQRRSRQSVRDARLGTNVFIGHGRSGAWRELKDFVQDRLQLPWDEFNRVPVAGVTNQARLAEMLDAAAIGLVIMTAEDETADGEMQARMNVIHEVGLFQGRLGFTKGIVLFEEGCQEFSNIQGLGQIRFPKGNIAACFEDVRRVLEREALIKP